MTHSILAWARC